MNGLLRTGGGLHNKGWGGAGEKHEKPGWCNPEPGSGKTGFGAHWGSHKDTGFGSANHHRRQRNFWGDINGDGKETAWDDVLGDGLLLDAMQAQARADRGEPPEPEDEFFLGRRPTASTGAVSASTTQGASGAAMALMAVGLAVCLCLLLMVLMQ